MTRKEFLCTIWNKGFKPILFLAVIYFCTRFIFNIFFEKGPERFITILILGLGLLFIMVSLIGIVFSSMLSKVKSSLPEPVKFWIKIVGRILNHIAPIIFGIILYHFWQKDWKTASFVIGGLLIQKVLEIIIEEKSTKADLMVAKEVD